MLLMMNDVLFAAIFGGCSTIKLYAVQRIQLVAVNPNTGNRTRVQQTADHTARLLRSTCLSSSVKYGLSQVAYSHLDACFMYGFV